jgi:hypothetical protein
MIRHFVLATAVLAAFSLPALAQQQPPKGGNLLGALLDECPSLGAPAPSKEKDIHCQGVLEGTVGTLMYGGERSVVCPPSDMGMSLGLVLQIVAGAAAAKPSLRDDQANHAIAQILTAAWPCDP